MKTKFNFSENPNRYALYVMGRGSNRTLEQAIRVLEALDEGNKVFFYTGGGELTEISSVIALMEYRRTHDKQIDHICRIADTVSLLLKEKE